MGAEIWKFIVIFDKRTYLAQIAIDQKQYKTKL